MSKIDADAVRQALDANALSRLANLETFAAIGSTNTYLMEQDAPDPGAARVAVTANQTAGRGRHGKTWQSPPGSGLALSMAYTFTVQPDNLPALTLVIGNAAIDALEELGVGGVQLKWPNDLIAGNAKLGGILTETQSQGSDAVTVVTGIGINLDLGPDFELAAEDEPARPATDIRSLLPERPRIESIAAAVINRVSDAFVRFESKGFADFAYRWAERDWLLGRRVIVESAQARVEGLGAGIAEDGALLVEVNGALQRVTSGTVLTPGGWAP